MIAKFAAILCLFGVAQAGYLHGSGLGYSGIGYGDYSGYAAPAYTAPVITKAVIPAVSYAPAVSTVSRYQIHSAPIVKSYVAPVTYAAAPIVSYGEHGYGGYGYGGHGYGGHGYGGHGYGGHGYASYGSKHLW